MVERVARKKRRRFENDGGENVKCSLSDFTAMLIKQKDDLRTTFDTLEGFLALPTLTKQQRESIEAELQRLRAGAKGEKDAAYHVDFRLKDTKNWAVIHDLRLEHNGRVAQIDHLLVGRFFDVFVIESKNLKTAVRVNGDGEFEVRNKWGWQGMASPVEQNKRHIHVLGSLIQDEKLMPTRLGFSIQPRFHNWVLVAPECQLSKGEQKDATILKTDMFDRGLEQFINHSPLKEAMTMVKLCSAETVTAFAEKLAGFHKPATFDYVAKFGITEAQRYAPGVMPQKATPPMIVAEQPTCDQCHAPVQTKVVNYCRAHEARFAGKILCRTCQTRDAGQTSVPVVTAEVARPSCQACGVTVDAKVVAFCRINRRRFGRKVLCRTCQTEVALTLS